MIDLSGDFGRHVAQRLQDEKVIWLTTVAADGTPQPNPVWFYWDGETILIYTQPKSAKLKNIARNPRVSLHFEGATPPGGDVVVLTGEAFVEASSPAPDPAYIDRYCQVIPELGYTVDQMYREYSVTLRVRPTRVRGFI